MKNLKIRLLTCAATLLCLSAFAQNQPAQNSINLFFEKVFIHTDRTIYTPGEEIWFKAYVVNAQDNHLIATSKNLYIEMIAPDGSISNKEIIRLDKGTGQGDISLSGQLTSGNYRLRAYTNWMRNFGDNFIFEKNIIITGKRAVTDKSFIKTEQTNKQIVKANAPSTNSANTPTLRFYPEGGSLITELSAIVAVKAEDALGNGIQVSGPILSATGDTVARFNCDSLGMGLFVILPTAGQKYHSSLNYKGQVISAVLPDVLNSGISLKVLKRDTLLYITISCNNAASAALTGKPLTLSIKHAGTAFVNQQILLNENQALIKIPISGLPEGVAVVSVYDDRHKPNCERLVYIEHPENKAMLAVSTEKSTFKSREKVVVNIRATDGRKHPVTGNFSLSAVDAGVDPSRAGDITAYIMLQSEVRGQIIHPERYFDTTNTFRTRQLDMLLLTQGWRDFVWKRLADTAIKISYLPEQGFTVSGTIKNESGKQTVPNSNVTLSTPKTIGPKLFYTQSDANGNFYFDNLKLSGDQTLTITTRDAKGKANGFIRLDSLNKNQLPVNHSGLRSVSDLPGGLTAELERRAPVNSALDSVTKLREVKINATNGVVLRDQTAVTAGYADEVLTVTEKDYSFTNLKDYILHMSKQAKTDPTNSEQLVFFADGKTLSPRIIVENKEAAFTEEDDADIQSHYYAAYYGLSMNVVQKVVIKRLLAGLKAPAIGRGGTANVLGNSIAGVRSSGPGFVFIIYLTLKPGALFKNGDGITTASVQGYYETRTFYKPIHSSSGFDSQKPDLRNTIHWEPEVKTDANGLATVTFYNADPKTNIRIVVQGVTDTGEPVSATKGYVVK